MSAPVKQTAVQKLELSQLNQRSVQQELMGDLDLRAFKIYFKRKFKLDAVDRVMDATVNLTVEGASTLKVQINDHDRALLRSGLLANKLDVQVDGLWWRFVALDKEEDTLILTFEEREVAVLRDYSKLKLMHGRPEKSASRARATRAEFVLNLIREVKEFRIPVRIPELHKVQPIESASEVPSWGQQTKDKTYGIPESATRTTGPSSGPASSNERLPFGLLTIKGQPATRDQMTNAEAILLTGSSMQMPRKVQVAAIMAAIQESTLRNLPGGDRDSVGLFQQRPSQGWGTVDQILDPVYAARQFFTRAIRYHNEDPTRPYWDLIQLVQRSAFPTAYAAHFSEATKIVASFGIPAGTAEAANLQQGAFGASGDYIFYRGKPVSGSKKWETEDSWTCIQRLAEEVQWRAFFVSGTFYFMSEEQLLRQRPLATITEFARGVGSINGNYDRGKKSAQLRILVNVGRWAVPPGSLVVLKNMGPWNGRWLVASFERSLFESEATITLKKARPALPEPEQDNLTDSGSTWANQSALDQVSNVTGGFVSPLPTDPHFERSEFGIPDAEGAPSARGIKYHAAKDWFAPGGTPLVAPVTGTLVEVRRGSTSSGQVFGGTVKLQQGDGIVWVFRHVDPSFAAVQGSVVQAGQQIASVTTWASSPQSSHAHIEIWRTLAGGYRYENMIDPVLYMNGKVEDK